MALAATTLLAIFILAVLTKFFGAGAGAGAGL